MRVSQASSLSVLVFYLVTYVYENLALPFSQINYFIGLLLLFRLMKSWRAEPGLNFVFLQSWPSHLQKNSNNTLGNVLLRACSNLQKISKRLSAYPSFILDAYVFSLQLAVLANSFKQVYFTYLKAFPFLRNTCDNDLKSFLPGWIL